MIARTLRGGTESSDLHSEQSLCAPSDLLVQLVHFGLPQRAVDRAIGEAVAERSSLAARELVHQPHLLHEVARHRAHHVEQIVRVEVFGGCCGRRGGCDGGRSGRSEVGAAKRLHSGRQPEAQVRKARGELADWLHSAERNNNTRTSTFS